MNIHKLFIFARNKIINGLKKNIEITLESIIQAQHVIIIIIIIIIITIYHNQYMNKYNLKKTSKIAKQITRKKRKLIKVKKKRKYSQFRKKKKGRGEKRRGEKVNNSS